MNKTKLKPFTPTAPHMFEARALFAGKTNSNHQPLYRPTVVVVYPEYSISRIVKQASFATSHKSDAINHAISMLNEFEETVQNENKLLIEIDNNIHD